METEDDPEYLSFLSYLRVCDNSYMFEIQPEGASSSVRVKYEKINPTCGMKPNCKSKRIRRDLSAREAVIEESGRERLDLEPDSVRSGKKWRKDNKEEASKIGNEVIASGRENASFEKERENPVRKDGSVDEIVEIQSQEASPLSNSVSTHFQGFMLLMKKLCPVETTIYPGWNDNNEDVIRPTAEPTKSKSMEFDRIEEKREIEAKPRHKGNKRGNVKIGTAAVFHELSDSDVRRLSF